MTDHDATAETTAAPPDDHEAWELRELERIRDERTIAPTAAPPPLTDVLQRIAKLAGRDVATIDASAHRCAGGCGLEVAERGWFCESCAEIGRQRLRGMELTHAYRSLDPDGELAWCRVELPEFRQRVAPALGMAAELAEGPRRQDAIEVLNGRWRRARGNVLILGPTGIGKSTAMLGIGHRVLDAAFAGAVTGDDFKFATRVRFVSGIDLGKAQARHGLGEGDPPLVGRAKGASLLLLDEIGFEDQRFDAHAIRDVIEARYRAHRPTIATSGKTRAELDGRYGAAMIRRFAQGSLVIDLHPTTTHRTR